MYESLTGLGCKQERNVLFFFPRPPPFFFLPPVCFSWKGHWLGGILPLQKLQLFPFSDLPGEMFLEQRGQIRCLGSVQHLGCLLPGPINTSKWHRAVLVLGQSWVLSYPLCHQFGNCLFWARCYCLQFEVLLAHGLYRACFSASPPLRTESQVPAVSPSNFGLQTALALPFSLVPRACKTSHLCLFTRS